MTFKDIIELTKTSPRSGLESLYQAYGEKFYSFCIHKWNLNEDEAWEIVYKTLETLVLKLANYEFESQSHFNNFLYKVLVNFLRQYFRSSRRRLELGVKFVDINEDSDTLTIIKEQIDQKAFTDYYDKGIVESPHLGILNECLEKMDQIDKDLLLLRAQNYSYEEIAKLLNIENNQLKVKHLRAKQKLVNLINQNQNKFQ